MDTIWNLYREFNKLKTLVRNGWKLREIPVERMESVAEHIFSMALLSMIIIRQENLKLDMSKVLEMTLIHELGEIDAGDFTPFHKITEKEKYDLEIKGVARISKLTNDEYLLNLWKEFEENTTPEAKFVKKMDKLEAIMQSQLYSEIIEDEYKLMYEFLNTSVDRVGEYNVLFEEFL